MKGNNNNKNNNNNNNENNNNKISDQKTKLILTLVNEAIHQLIAKLPLNLSLTNINHLMYATSWVIIDSLKIKIEEKTDLNKNQSLIGIENLKRKSVVCDMT